MFKISLKINKINFLDLGGAYIGVTQNHLHRMLEELDIKQYKIDETTNTIVYDADTGN